MAELQPFYSDYGDECHFSYKDDTGKFVVPVNTYDTYDYFSEDLAVVTQGNGYGYGYGVMEL